MKSLFLFVFMAFIAITTPALALSSDWQGDDSIKIRLISGVEGVGEESVIPLALDVELASGWHTYWRSPGEAGLPPQIDWQNNSDNSNLQDAEMLYPAPKRYTAFGLETIGYRDHIVFPIDAHLRAPGHVLELTPTVSLLVCSSLCVPKNFMLKLTIPEGAATESSESNLIKEFRNQVPSDAAKSGIVIQSLINRGQSLSVTLTSRTILQAPDIFVEDDQNVSFSAPLVVIGDDAHTAELTIKMAEPLPTGKTLAGVPIDLTIVDGDDALQTHVTIPEVTVPPLMSSGTSLSFSVALFLALCGGFILNLMPCVLPVLSLKILGVISHGGGNYRSVRHSFLMSAAGILFSFLLLAGVTLVLKKLGMAFGWGVQFQQPLFLLFLSLLLVFFTANLWGLFEIPLPRFLADTLTGPYHPKLAGDFAAGALATLLATPCTAPFLGTAVGFALASESAFDIAAIFFMLGLGMTLPYLAIAAFPRIATALPKPGSWMIKLRYILGCALALTVIWLIWVLAAQITTFFAALIGFCFLIIIIFLALHNRILFLRQPLLYGVGLFSLLVLVIGITGSNLPKVMPIDNKEWVLFDEQVIAQDVAEGKTVFVDVTADWCLTCKANKKFILSQDTLNQRLFHSDIVAMQADWTNPNSAITGFLQKFQRYGIPFNAVFGPNAPQGIVLPELLSTDVVMKALDRASHVSAP